MYETIKQNFEFHRLYRKEPVVTPYFVLYTAQNNMGINRLGITTGKTIGKAHLRNRARRVIREAYRQLLKENPQIKGRDFLFVARTKTAYMKTQSIYTDMAAVFKNYEKTSNVAN